MTLQEYLRNKQSAEERTRSHRQYCPRCRKPQLTCYCATLRPFDSTPTFAILMHTLEKRRSVATGRMAHLSLSNSLLFEGLDFTENSGVNGLIADPNNHCLLLYPKQGSQNLTGLSGAERRHLFPRRKRPVIFVVDGTWAQARRMVRLSRNLHPLPMICFTPETPSRFLVRRQPEEHFYSTIESIHECISLLGDAGDQPIDNLLHTFAFMVNQQIEFEMNNAFAREASWNHSTVLRRP